MATSKTTHKLEVTAEESASAKIKKTEAQIRALNRQLTRMGGNSESAFKKGMDAVAGFGKGVAKVGAAFGAAAGAIGLMTAKVADHNDKVGKLSERLGTSTEFLSQMGYAAELSGKDLDKVADALTDLNEKATNSEDKFKKWGIATKDANGEVRKTEDIILDVSDRMKELQTSSERVAMANDLMGGSGRELVPLLQQGSAAFRQMALEADNFGATVSGKAAQAAAFFNDQLSRMKSAAGGLFRDIGTALMPGLSAIMGGMTQIFVGIRDQFRLAEVDSGKLAQSMFNGFKMVASFLADSFAAAVLTIKGLVNGATNAAVQAVAKLAEAKARVDELFGRDEAAASARNFASALREGVAAVDEDYRKFSERLAGVKATIEGISFQAGGTIAAPVAPAQPGFSIPEAPGGQVKEAKKVDTALAVATSQQLAAAKSLSSAATKQDNSAQKQMQAAGMLQTAGGALVSVFRSDASAGKKLLGLGITGLQIAAAGSGNPFAAAGVNIASQALGFAEGGFVPNAPGSRPDTDSVPALLTPGEYVMTKEQVSQAMGSGGGSSFNISFNTPNLPNQAQLDRWMRDTFIPSVGRLKSQGVKI